MLSDIIYDCINLTYRFEVALGRGGDNWLLGMLLYVVSLRQGCFPAFVTVDVLPLLPCEKTEVKSNLMGCSRKDRKGIVPPYASYRSRPNKLGEESDYYRDAFHTLKNIDRHLVKSLGRFDIARRTILDGSPNVLNLEILRQRSTVADCLFC